MPHWAPSRAHSTACWTSGSRIIGGILTSRAKGGMHADTRSDGQAQQQEQGQRQAWRENAARFFHQIPGTHIATPVPSTNARPRPASAA